jgi:hypothetical protein
MKAKFGYIEVQMHGEVSPLFPMDEWETVDQPGQAVAFRVTTDGLQSSELVVTNGDETDGVVAVPSGYEGTSEYSIAVGDRIFLELPGGNLSGLVAGIYVEGERGVLSLREAEYTGSAGSLLGGTCASCHWDARHFSGEVETSAWDEPLDWQVYLAARNHVVNSGHFYGHPEANREALRLVIGELLAIDLKLHALAESHGLLREQTVYAEPKPPDYDWWQRDAGEDIPDEVILGTGEGAELARIRRARESD